MTRRLTGSGSGAYILADMGEHHVFGSAEARDIRAFTQAVLADLRALETVLAQGMIESGVRRVGVEQEMFLIDRNCRPFPLADELLRRLSDERFTTELARFNLEANLPPIPFRGDFLRRLDVELTDLVTRVRREAGSLGGDVLLTGILPTLRPTDLGIENMTPQERYRRMNHELARIRGGKFHVHIDGLEEFDVTHDSVMIEAANTSLQLHLQVGMEEFARLYNLAQLISAPLLAAATNSPILLGRRLWHETRVALFERSIDERSEAQIDRGMPTRVGFGDAWVAHSVLEIFRENAARFHVIITCQSDPDPFTQIAQGIAPTLSALTLHNGTVWRWNRPCYGVANGSPHLRIENRVLPAGPTIPDEVANAALFYGMMQGLADEYADVPSRIPFSDAKANLMAAAQHGVDANFRWLEGREVSARQLLLDELIPKAREGLRRLDVPEVDLQIYLGTVEERVRLRRTGSRWLLEGLNGLQGKEAQDDALTAITAAMRDYQVGGHPVHRWRPAQPKAMQDNPGIEPTIAEIMTSDVFTVRPQDVLDLATSVMEWKHIRHVPVEDERGRLVGLLSQGALLRALNASLGQQPNEPVAVERFMDRNPLTIPANKSLREAMRLLLSSDTGCLLVVTNGRLVGIVTERDLLAAAGRLLERQS